MVAGHGRDRLRSLEQFYEIMANLEARIGGKRTLNESHGRMEWPRRGLYFFFEPGERRRGSGDGPRVVRVGTHALKASSQTSLWDRLRKHKGVTGGRRAGGGNHRGSVFRLHIGSALIRRDGWAEAASTWGVRSNAPGWVREREHCLECAVSQHIRRMPFLWVAAGDEPGLASVRGYVERNAIALLSSYGDETAIDPPSKGWLGNWAVSREVRMSGLWNVNHVTDHWEPAFLDVLWELSAGMGV